MITTFFDYEWDYWTTTKKVTFDGDRRLIIVNEGVTDLDIRTDVYSRWVDWRDLDGNMGFTKAMRFTGLDTTPNGPTGDIYFLRNNWKLVVDLASVRVSGVLFSDDFDTAYYTPSLAAQYPASVSTLVNTIEVNGGGTGTAEVDVNAIATAVLNAIEASRPSVTAINAATTAEISTLIDTQTVTINNNTNTAVSGIDANVDLTPVINAIAGLNDVSVADIETSLVLAKEGTLDSIANAVALIPTTNVDVNLTPVLSAISGLNDVTPQEVRDAFNAVDFQSKNTELEIHTWLDSYPYKNKWKADTVDITPILTAINSLENLSLLDIEGSTSIAKQATLNAIVASVAALPTDNADLTPVLSAIAGLNDVTPAQIRAYFNEADFKDKNTEAEVHAWLDSYVNKDNWKASGAELANAVWEDLL